MAGNYEKGMYNQLMEVMAWLDAVESDLHTEKIEHSNTSLPPSTDQKGGKPANTYNGREKTGRKAGGQKGHKGTTFTKAEAEEKIRSGSCRHVIKEIGNPSPKGYLTKYIVDLAVAPLITEIRIHADREGKFTIPPEYRSDITYGPTVKALAVDLYSEGVMSNDRIASFLNAAGNGELGLSDGSVYRFCKAFSDRAQESLSHLEEKLLIQAVVSTDATVVTVNGKQNYIRNFSVANTVVYHTMKKKTIEAMKGLPFLRRFTGILVYDHETALYHFGRDHGECNVHIIRYLRKNTDDTGNSWSGRMSSLLCGMNRVRKELIGQEIHAFPVEEVTAFEKSYQELITRGREENKKTRHRYAQKEEKTLLNLLAGVKPVSSAGRLNC